MLIIACMGTINNAISISFFLRRKSGNIGDKFLVILNSLDTIICMYSLFPMTKIVHSFRTDQTLSVSEHILLLTIFEMLVEFSGLATCFLCALRASSINWPLHLINRKKVYTAAVLAAFYIVASTYFMWLSPNSEEEKTGQESNAREFLSLIFFFANISIMIIFVIACSIISVKALYKKIPQISAAQRSDTNDKAAKMVLILSLLFVTFNTAWASLPLFYMTSDEHRKAIKEGRLDEHGSGSFSILTYTIMSLNSAVNPIVYMTRNKEMNQYVKQTLIGNAVRITRNLCLPKVGPQDSRTVSSDNHVEKSIVVNLDAGGS